jgi:ribonuclease P protein component
VKKEGFPQSIRVKKESEFARIIGRGARSGGEYLILFRLQGDEDQGQRFGIRIPRGIKRAVDRNKIKRAVREVVRRNKARFAKHESVVVMCRSAAAGAPHRRLQEDLENLIR